MTVNTHIHPAPSLFPAATGLARPTLWTPAPSNPIPPQTGSLT